MRSVAELKTTKTAWTLAELGWKPAFEREYEKYRERYKLARVAVEQRGQYVVLSETGEMPATVSGKLMHDALGRCDYPAVGDWVLVTCPPGDDRAVIHGILPRTSKFSRKVAGLVSEEQIVAVNIDVVFICMGLDHNFNLRRLERYLVLAWESGALPVVVLTKADICDNLPGRLAETLTVAAGTEVIPISSVDGTGLPVLSERLAGGLTGALLGSSGVGKSTLVNALLGEQRQATTEVREDDSRGRHTTTYRELIPISGGGLIIDTPGMRELSFHGGDDFSGAFDDIEGLAGQCRFADCRHENEPGCAVLQAIDEGLIERERLVNYRKMQREAALAEQKARRRQAAIEKTQNKKHVSELRNQPAID